MQAVKRKIAFILHLAKSVFSLGLKASDLVPFHYELIQSGFVWRALQFNFFSL